MKRSTIVFADLRRSDTSLAGGKGANLGELTNGGLPVPDGFVVTSDAYLAAMDESGVREELRQELRRALEAADDPATLAASAHRLRDLVVKAGIPRHLADEIIDALGELGGGAVAVRSSATAEDTAGTSFAGMHDTYANVLGEDDVLARIVDCWRSLYNERVIAYRASRGLTDEPAIAVVVQDMAPATKAGVMFSADPTTGDRERTVIEAAFGLGEVVVSGAVEPDTYTVAGEPPALISVRVGHQDHQIVPDDDGHLVHVELDDETADRRVLTDEEIFALVALGRRITELYGDVPQDIEWAIGPDGVQIVQSRPITTLAHEPTLATAAGTADVLARGLGATPGVATGPVRILMSPEQGRALQAGEVLVAPMTNPDWVPTLRRAAAVVTDGGGMTCHAAIVARELGVPCVVGTRTATTALHDGQVVTVDGSAGTASAGTAPIAAAARSDRPTPGDRPEPKPWPPGSTSTWRWPTGPRSSLRNRWMASGCYAPS